MALHDDPRLDLSRALPMDEVVARLGIPRLRRTGAELVGPCPLCGGRDRFAISLRTHAHLCRKCGIRGGDQVGLVMSVLGLPFSEVREIGDPPRKMRVFPPLDWLMGADVAPIDSAKLAARREAARMAEARERAEIAAQRQAAIGRGRAIWRAAGPPDQPVLRAYLAGRGLPHAVLARLAPVIRFAPALPYRRRVGGGIVDLHIGPAMVAVIQGPDGRGMGAHCTWIDPDRPGAKASITARMAENGDAPWPAKLIMGSQKGGAIRLTDTGAATLVVGEGIETTLTALAADAVPSADYWAGISLGNMGGRMQRIAGLRQSGQPDLTDAEAFVPPPWVTRLVFIQDGDSDPVATRARLMAGLIRAAEARPGLRGQIVAAPPGQDLNDLVKPARVDAEGGAR